MHNQKSLSQIVLLLLIFSVTSCAGVSSKPDEKSIQSLNPESKGIFITPYGDFGPPQLSSYLLGNKWWQWDDPDNHKPVRYDVKVLVYRGLPLDDVKNAFPVVPEKKQDYRYVTYKDARTYIDATLLQFEKDMGDAQNPEEVAIMSIFPLRLYKTALAMERKLRE